MEKKFVDKAEKWWFKNSMDESQEFQSIAFNVADAVFDLLHAISISLLGKKLPKAREPYTAYDDIFKGPTYDVLISEIQKGKSKTYQYRLNYHMKKLCDFPRDN